MNEVIKSAFCDQQFNGNRVLISMVVGGGGCSLHECNYLTNKGNCIISRNKCSRKKGEFKQVQILP